MEKLNVKIKLEAPKAKTPEAKSDLAAGYDLFVIEGGVLEPDRPMGRKWSEDANGEAILIDCLPNDPAAVEFYVKRSPLILDTGIALEIPAGYELEIRSRSGLGIKYEVVAFNGTIDADYRGTLKIKVWNLGSEPFIVEEGMRIAQAVFKKIALVDFELATLLSDTTRGVSGFGDSGLK